MDDILLEEVNLVQDIELALAVNVPEELELEELNEGLNEVESLSQNYRRVHAKLKLDLKEKYDFPKADDLLGKISIFMKSAMKRALNREEMKRRKLLNVSLAPENIVFVTVSQRKYNLLLLLSHKVEVEEVLQ